MMKWFMFAIMMMFAGAVSAIDSIEFSFDPPTTRTDATPLAQTDIANYEIGCSSTSDVGPFDEWRFDILAAGVTPHPTGAIEVPPKVATWHCIAYTVDTGGLVSPMSNVATYVPPAPPGSPQNAGMSCYGDCNRTLQFNITISP